MRCSVNDEECGPGRLWVGMCSKHYKRLQTHGTTANPRIDNLRRYTVDDAGCWLWDGPLWRNGYGKPSAAIHGTRLAHRMMYVEHVGPIPDGMDLDHLCRVRRCCNPAHLESRTMCAAGLHDITAPDATKPGTRQCLACWRIRYKAAGERYRARRREPS